MSGFVDTTTATAPIDVADLNVEVGTTQATTHIPGQALRRQIRRDDFDDLDTVRFQNNCDLCLYSEGG